MGIGWDAWALNTQGNTAESARNARRERGMARNSTSGFNFPQLVNWRVYAARGIAQISCQFCILEVLMCVAVRHSCRRGRPDWQPVAPPRPWTLPLSLARLANIPPFSCPFENFLRLPSSQAGNDSSRGHCRLRPHGRGCFQHQIQIFPTEAQANLPVALCHVCNHPLALGWVQWNLLLHLSSFAVRCCHPAVPKRRHEWLNRWTQTMRRCVRAARETALCSRSYLRRRNPPIMVGPDMCLVRAVAAVARFSLPPRLPWRIGTSKSPYHTTFLSLRSI